MSDDEFLGWLCAADVAVDLRFPHRGEVSGSLARAMQAGLPTVVSATGTYLDVPDELVLRVAPGPTDAAELAATLRRLVDDPELRARDGRGRAGARGAAARDRGHGARLRGGDRDARSALVRDPVRKAEARWAGALADIGVGEDELAPGLRRRLRPRAGVLRRRAAGAGARIPANTIGASPARLGPVARLARAR